MQFINPAGFLALGLIPILILIHSLRPKPKKIDVTNLFLWQMVLAETRGGARLTKAIKNLPLLFQILTVIMAALALSQPVWTTTTGIKGNMILVIDTSASMKTRTESGSRFDAARRAALELIDDLPENREMLVIEAGSKPMLRLPFSNDGGRLKETILKIHPTDTPGSMEKSVYLALSFMDIDRDDSCFLITDGAGYEFSKISGLHKNITPVLIAGGERNIGITKFEFRQDPLNQDQFAVMAEIINFNPEPVLCPIHLAFDGNTFAKETTGLRALEKKLLFFNYSGLMAGTARMSLDLEDDFPTDNQAHAVLNPSGEVRVLLVSKGNFYMEKLLEAYPNFRVTLIREIDASATPSVWQEQIRQHDIVILDRVSSPPADKGSFLLINAFSPSFPFEPKSSIDFPEVVDWNRKHAITADLNLSGLNIEQAAVITPGGGALPLVESRQTGLIFSYAEGGVKAVFMGFDITRSDLPVRVAFPVMMSNIFNWLHPGNIRFRPEQVKAGHPYTVYPESRKGTISIRPPAGEWEGFDIVSGPLIYENTGEVGVYAVTEGDRQTYFAVNLLDESESDIRTPLPEPGKREDPTGGGAEPIPLQKQVWLFFLVFAAAAILPEWYFWLNRK